MQLYAVIAVLGSFDNLIFISRFTKISSDKFRGTPLTRVTNLGASPWFKYHPLRYIGEHPFTVCSVFFTWVRGHRNLSRQKHGFCTASALWLNTPFRLKITASKHTLIYKYNTWTIWNIWGSKLLKKYQKFNAILPILGDREPGKKRLKCKKKWWLNINKIDSFDCKI